MLICKFTHDSSLICDGTRFWVIGPEYGLNNWHDVHDAAAGTIIAAVNLDEGRCHLLMSSGYVFQVEANSDIGFVVQKVKN